MKNSLRVVGVLALSVSVFALSACSSADSDTESQTTTASAEPGMAVEEASVTDFADIAASDACVGLREEYPDYVGTTMTNALNPYTPGYETVDPDNPSEFIGFDIDFGNAIAACLGFDVDYVSVGFSELIPTVASGQADWILSNLYATEDRAEGGVDFVSYMNVYDGVLVAKDNPKEITGIDTSLCGLTVALNKGYVEVPLVEAIAPECAELGLPDPVLSLFDNTADCTQAILAGRADAYMNDVNTVNRFIAEHPDDLESADTLMLDYTIGIGLPQGEHDFRDALVGAVTEIQDTGLQAELTAIHELDESAIAPPTVLSVA